MRQLTLLDRLTTSARTADDRALGADEQLQLAQWLHFRAKDPRAARNRERLLESFLPLIRRVAYRFHHRGSLEVDDLVQVGVIAAMKAIPTFDPRRSTSLAARVHWVVARACRDHIRLHSADVHQSEGAARGRTARQAKGLVEPVVSVLEPPADPQKEALSLTAHALLGRDDETPEKLVLEQERKERLAKAVRGLPAKDRDLLRRVFGLGREPESVCSVAEATGVPKSRVQRQLARALAQLREMLEE